MVWVDAGKEEGRGGVCNVLPKKADCVLPTGFICEGCGVFGRGDAGVHMVLVGAGKAAGDKHLLKYAVFAVFATNKALSFCNVCGGSHTVTQTRARSTPFFSPAVRTGANENTRIPLYRQRG